MIEIYIYVNMSIQIDILRFIIFFLHDLNVGFKNDYMILLYNIYMIFHVFMYFIMYF